MILMNEPKVSVDPYPTQNQGIKGGSPVTVHERMEYLYKEIENLAETVRILVARLDPVLNPEEVNEKGTIQQNSNINVTGSELAENIRSRTHDLTLIQDFIHRTIDRLSI